MLNIKTPPPNPLKPPKIHCLFIFHGGITSKRFELETSNLIWCFVMMICFAYCSRKKFGPPYPLKPPQVPSFLFIFLDGITSKRFELETSNSLWWFVMMIRFACCSRIKIRPPNPLNPPKPPNFHLFFRIG